MDFNVEFDYTFRPHLGQNLAFECTGYPQFTHTMDLLTAAPQLAQKLDEDFNALPQEEHLSAGNDDGISCRETMDFLFATRLAVVCPARGMNSNNNISERNNRPIIKSDCIFNK